MRDHDDRLGYYELKPFTKNRQNIALIAGEGWRKHSLHAIIEVDVTRARELIKEHKRNGHDISFTGWIIKCVAQAVSEHNILNAYRQGKRKIVVFKDVDVPIPVERRVGEKIFLTAYIIRKANEKSIEDITREIRSAQSEKIEKSTVVLVKDLTLFERAVLKTPLFIKKFVIWLTRNNGLFRKKHMGTVAVTAIGMSGKLPGWGIPLGGTTSTLVVVGGITKKPGVVDDKIMIREYLHLTVTVDHDVVDGSPLVRFIDKLVDLMENAYGLSS